MLRTSTNAILRTATMPVPHQSQRFYSREYFDNQRYAESLRKSEAIKEENKENQGSNTAQNRLRSCNIAKLADKVLRCHIFKCKDVEPDKASTS